MMKNKDRIKLVKEMVSEYEFEIRDNDSIINQYPFPRVRDLVVRNNVLQEVTDYLNRIIAL